MLALLILTIEAAQRIPTVSNDIDRQQTKSQIYKAFALTVAPAIALNSVTAISDFVGTYILSLSGENGIAAGGLYSSLQLTVQGLIQSWLLVVGPLAAQIDSEELSKQKGTTLFVFTMALGAVFSVPMMLWYYYSNDYFLAIGEDANVTALASDAFIAYVPGCWADVLLMGAGQFAIARKEGVATLVTLLLQKTTALVFAYCLALGIGDFPEMGAAGLGYSYSIFAILALIAFTAYLIARGHFVKVTCSDLLSQRSQMQDIFKYGWPVFIHIGSELVILAWLIQMSGQISAASLAAVEIVCRYAAFPIVVSIGLSQGVGILVAQYQDSIENTRKVVQIGKISTSAITLFSIITFAIFPQQMSDLFLQYAGDGVNGTKASDFDEDVKSISIWVFIIFALSNIPDGSRTLDIGALRGKLDTTAPMVANVAQSIICLGLAYLFLYTTDLGAKGLFIARGISLLPLAGYLWHRLERKISLCERKVPSHSRSRAGIYSRNTNRPSAITGGYELSDHGLTVCDDTSIQAEARAIPLIV